MPCIFTISSSSRRHLLGSLVNLFQKADKDLLLQPRLGLVHLLNHLDDLVVRLLFVLGESPRDVDIRRRKDLLDLLLASRVPSSIVFLYSTGSIHRVSAPR
jgi:hypothetical protein